MSKDIMGNYGQDAGLIDPFDEPWLELEYQVDQGSIDPMSAYVKLYQMKRQIDDVVSRIKQEALVARLKYDRKEVVERDGFEIQLASRKSYSFDHDDSYNSLKAELKERESLMKKAAAMSEKNQQLVVHGEVIEPALIGETEYIKMQQKR